ncbi:hypothetical protein WIS52_18345 [Pseudonocardia nematodicida]|uniref:Poly-beta-hydroxybutyrate polymerase N-terminal domain-containing protein n=1 Tax=Pseudonocardia nematodicida TaxID=1206997 RepID=A0ABV1KGI3_9PSEU
MSARDGGPVTGGSPGRPGAPPPHPLVLPAAGLRLLAALVARPSSVLRRGGAWVGGLGRAGLGLPTGAGRTGSGNGAPAAGTAGQGSAAPAAGAAGGGHRPPVAGWWGVLHRRAAAAGHVTVRTLHDLLDDAATPGPHPLPRADADVLRGVLPGPGTTHPRAPGTAGAPAPGATGTPAGLAPSVSAAPTFPEPAPATPATAPMEPAPDRAAVSGRIFTPPGPGDPQVPFDTGARDAGGGPVRGRDVAATPGAVVLRTPMFELLQYLPVTEEVHDTPVLVVPPLVHRYWLADLAPRFSLVEHLLARGLQVLALSWRPAGPADADRDLDAHAAAVLDALEVTTRITRAPRVSLLGVRTGGLLAAAVQAHLAAIGLEDRVATAGYLATVLDPAATLPGFRPDAGVTRAAAEQAARDGVLDGPTAVRAWEWRRGTERVLPFSVPAGPAPGPGDRPAPVPGRVSRAMRAWAADLMPLPAALHTDLVALAGTRVGAVGGLRVLGTPLRPAVLRRDGYVLAAADDPVQPWTGGLRTARMLGGRCRLVLAPGDQAGVVVAPPGPVTSFLAGGCAPGTADPEAWRAAATHVEGSWWDDLADWLAERSGTLRDAPPELGGRRLRPLFPAPGTYLGTTDTARTGM